MGSCEDFETAETDAKTTGSNPFEYNTERRRLFRDPDDHLISGVCAGIANYFDINPVWVRLAFVILAFAFCRQWALLYTLYYGWWSLKPLPVPTAWP
jgi:phage shock protein PspC (stress-responsive transcriptional regulator)